MATKQKASETASKAAKAPAKKAVPASKKAATKPASPAAAVAKAPVKAASTPAPASADAKKPASKSKVAAASKKTPVKTASSASASVASAKKAGSPTSQTMEKEKGAVKAAEPKSSQPVKAAPSSGKAVKVTPEVSEAPVTVPVPKSAARPRAKEEKPAKPVPMPKITATTSRKYEPDFTRSILDQPSIVNLGPTMRYSDAELQEFRELITRKLESAKKELTFLSGLISRKDEMSGDESESRYMTMEDGSLSMEREQLNQMASRQIDFIEKLEKALVRIENKTYGICRETGNLIDKARLRAVPHATLCIEAKMKRNRNTNS